MHPSEQTRVRNNTPLAFRRVELAADYERMSKIYLVSGLVL